jgi:hypothetical protein
MNNLKDYTQFVNEVKTERDIVKSIARRLSLDKDVIKYLNTSRAKREIGWRELLQQKLHGGNLNYINYITKNMVADYNPQITGYVNIGKGEGGYGDGENGENAYDFGNPELGKTIRNVEKRLEDIEDVLGIDLEDEETLDRAKDKLQPIIGYEDSDFEEEE